MESYIARGDLPCWCTGRATPLGEEKGGQEDYADRAGIPRTYVSDIERSVRGSVIAVVEKLAKPLGVEAAALPMHTG